MERYEVLGIVGQGTFGTVHKVRCRADRQLYCLKRIPMAAAKDGNSGALMEAKARGGGRQGPCRTRAAERAPRSGCTQPLSELLSGLDHPNIIRYKESFIDPADGALCIVTTYCSGGDLFAAIRRRAAGGRGRASARGDGGGGDGGGGDAADGGGEGDDGGGDEGNGEAGAADGGGGGGGSGSGGSATSSADDDGCGGPDYFSEDEVMDLFLQIAGALHYIHGRSILHRDLKTQNILLDGNGVPMLADFGISKVLQQAEGYAASTVVGTPYYLSPEVCLNKPYTFKSDVWALGCVLYEMATLRHAFAAESLLSLVYQIIKGDVPPLPSGRFSPELDGLIRRLLAHDPAARPSLQEVLMLPYVQHHVQRFSARERRRVLDKHLSMQSILRRSGSLSGSLSGALRDSAPRAGGEAGAEAAEAAEARQPEHQRREQERQRESEGGAHQREQLEAQSEPRRQQQKLWERQTAQLLQEQRQQQQQHQQQQHQQQQEQQQQQQRESAAGQAPAGRAESAFFSPLTRHLHAAKQPVGALGWGGGLVASRRSEPGEVSESAASGSSAGSAGAGNPDAAARRAGQPARDTGGAGGDGGDGGGLHRLAVSSALPGSSGDRSLDAVDWQGACRRLWQLATNGLGGSQPDRERERRGDEGSEAGAGAPDWGAPAGRAPAGRLAAGARGRPQAPAAGGKAQAAVRADGVTFADKQQPAQQQLPQPQQQLPQQQLPHQQPAQQQQQQSPQPAQTEWLAAHRPNLSPIKPPATPPGAPQTPTPSGAGTGTGGGSTAAASSTPSSPFRFGLSDEERSMGLQLPWSSDGGGCKSSHAGAPSAFGSEPGGAAGSSAGGGGYGGAGAGAAGLPFALPCEDRLRFGLPTDETDECVFEIPLQSDAGSIGGGAADSPEPPGGPDSGPQRLDKSLGGQLPPLGGRRSASAFLRMVRRSYSSGGLGRSNLGRAVSLASAASLTSAVSLRLGCGADGLGGDCLGGAGSGGLAEGLSGGLSGAASGAEGSDGDGSCGWLSADFKVLCVDDPSDGAGPDGKLRGAASCGAPAEPAGGGAAGAGALRRERAELRQRLRIIKSVSDLSRSSLSSGSGAAAAAAVAGSPPLLVGSASS
ncbi:hypothetical protein Rsub_02726 [Raphidocelis subcapitata]|uniref:non-specific serine/threonine protein kinase n=1 Tax=Raphidocelis subcapitata TaxID=307507 RepID=A0A2V0NWS2_9CHLO|nr:hypothetical protein Rsub_02726 [Raphidocelis subcapitata]|eukprot:GBF90020.1 hypothetical protein Rsub_02726 [Raphidocelis subcapitata]